MFKKPLFFLSICSLFISLASAQDANSDDDGWYDDVSAQRNSEAEFVDLRTPEEQPAESQHKEMFEQVKERQHFIPRKLTFGGHLDGGVSKLKDKEDLQNSGYYWGNGWGYTVYNFNVGALVAFPFTEAFVLTSGLGLSYRHMKKSEYSYREVEWRYWDEVIHQNKRETDHSRVHIYALSIPVEVRYIIQPSEFFWAGAGVQPYVVVKQQEEYFLEDGDDVDNTVYDRFGGSLFADLGTRVSYISLIFDFGVKFAVDFNQLQINNQYSARSMSVGAFVDVWIN